ncbi:MAG: UbiA family prenyltransferase [Candidatus Methanoperedens sp.]
MDWWEGFKSCVIHKIADAFYLLIYSSIYLSIAGASMVYISCTMQHIPYSPSLLAIMFLATFSVYNINRKTDEKEDAINHSDRYSFTSHYGKVLSTSAILAYVLVIALALCYGVKTALISVIPLVCGILYSITWLPEKFKYRRLKEIPCGKNLVVAFAWASTPALLPVSSSSSNVAVATLIVIIFFFTLVFINSVVFDMRDTEGDAASGVKTIPVIIGLPKTIKFLSGLNIFSGIIILPLSLSYLSLGLTCILTTGMIYANFYILFFNKEKMTNLLCDAVADGQFILFGSLLYIAI